MLVHSSDGTTGWAGLLNQSGYTLWMPLAFYMLVVAFEQRIRWRADAALVAAMFFQHLSLWSYESQFLIILAAPVLLFWRFPRPWRCRKVIAAAWYILPAVYLIATYRKYAYSGGKTYQQSVLRKVWGISPVLRDWVFNISASLKFWTWRGSPAAHASFPQLLVPAALAVILFLLGMVLLIRSNRAWLPDRRALD